MYSVMVEMLLVDMWHCGGDVLVDVWRCGGDVTGRCVAFWWRCYW